MKRLVVIVSVLLGFGSVSAATAVASSASMTGYTAPGGACVFNAQKVIDGLGHVGWGFELPTGNWEYGANDGAGKGGKSNTWVRTGSKAAMVAMFAHGGPGQENDNYNRYRCATVKVPNSYAAELQVNREQGEPYYIYLQDCETDAYHVLTEYGVANLPSTAWFPDPNAWFLLLPVAGFGSVVSL